MSTMPFGKFKGRELSALPSDYLHWLLNDVDLREPLLSAVLREWRTRMSRVPEPSQSIAIDPRDVEMLRQIFDRGYKSLSRDTHPDFGGNEDEQKRLNALAVSLRSQLMQLGRAA